MTALVFQGLCKRLHESALLGGSRSPWDCVAEIAFNHPCGVYDGLDAAHAGDDRLHAYAPARHLRVGDDDDDDRARHVHACGYDVPRHDAHNVELRDLLVREDVVLPRWGLLVLPLSYNSFATGSIGLR